MFSVHIGVESLNIKKPPDQTTTDDISPLIWWHRSFFVKTVRYHGMWKRPPASEVCRKSMFNFMQFFLKTPPGTWILQIGVAIAFCEIKVLDGSYESLFPSHQGMGYFHPNEGKSVSHRGGR